MLFWIILLAAATIGAYLIYNYGMRGAIAVVSSGIAGIAAWFAGLFDKIGS